MVMGQMRQETEVVVLGGGPGGYVAAIRAADLGKEVVLVDDRGRLGGTCLLEGCIPSKALINAVEVAEAARAGSRFGLTFTDLAVDTGALRAFVTSVVDGLEKGVRSLLKRRGVEVVVGRARFESSHSLVIPGAEVSAVDFRHCIIATGSRARRLPVGEDLGLWSSADALALPEVPPRLVVVGGGYIGLELGLVYAGLGSKVTVVQSPPRLLKGADPDLVEIMVRHCEDRFDAILESRVRSVTRTASGFAVTVESKATGATDTLEAERVLVATGRDPNTGDLDLARAGVATDERGAIPVDDACRTAIPHIFAVGDVAPGPMLAHKATREAKVAAEVIAEHPSAFDNRAIPAVVFTDPEIAWAGLTEEEARRDGVEVAVGRFPLQALGRARTLGRTEGLVKVLSEPGSGLVLGVGMVGPHVSEIIAEATLALEMGATLEDLMVTIHPHPTLSEAIVEAAEAATGSATHLPPRKG